MQIQYCSDLHLEFAANSKFIKKHPLIPKAEVLILAGDIVPFSVMHQHEWFFDFVSANFKHTYWLPGNHEYYGVDAAERTGSFIEEIRSNVSLVNNHVTEIQDIALLFSTLWSAITPPNEFYIQKNLSDFYAVKYNGGAFTPYHFNWLHRQGKAFIQNTLPQVTHRQTVVVTHHVPTFLHYPTKYKNSILSEGFATELYDVIEPSAIKHWVYGHHHYNTPLFTLGQTQMHTNQLGYINYKENKGFNYQAVIDL